MAGQKEIVFEYRVPGGKVQKEQVDLEAQLRMKALGTVFLYGIQDGISPEELKRTGLDKSNLEGMASGCLEIPAGVIRREMKQRIVNLGNLLVQKDPGLERMMGVLGLKW